MQQPVAGASEVAEPPATSHGSAAEERVSVVGIGASAGGLEAFTRLLRQLPADLGCAFVLVQHLDASHPSLLPEILARATAMPVNAASDGELVSANRVYVIPPNVELTISDRVLRLAPRPPTGAHMPIDRFLQSLAEDCGGKAVGVILSGTGADGVAGILAIKDANGMTFAQDPQSAEFSGMPAMAASAGSADFVLSPEGIAATLTRVMQHPLLALGSEAATSAQPAAPVAELRAVCDVMYEATGIDFSLYRETTVQRRILRRLAVRGLTDLGEYERLLASDPNERSELRQDLLICVTRFFREPESFDALKAHVFPALLRGRAPNAAIRIWVPGCATGEEAYSILIALQEYQSECRSTFPVQLFATDINEAAIQKGRAGSYPPSITSDVDPERMRRYFTQVKGAYHIAKSLREACVFSRHNLLDDPPFSKLDLISCRNVLIYLQGAQRRLIPLFHYALVEPGFLMLGRSEATHDSELFSLVNSRHRIYARRQVARRPYSSFARARGGQAPSSGRLQPPEAQPARGVADLSRDADRVLLSRYSPAGVVVDEALEVLEIRGQTAPFLALTAGKASFHLLKLLPDTGLFLEVERLIREAAATGEVARGQHIPHAVDGTPGQLDIEVTPLGQKDRRAFLVLFEGASATPPGSAPSRAGLAADDAGRGRDAHMARLHRELKETRARLVSLVDDHETADAENQQITDDAISANEELQSLTEELETAKEELQATNEELLTLNRELESRNTALATAGTLSRTTIETVGVPLLVADPGLIIKYVNAAFARLFGLSAEGAEGQHLFELSSGAWNRKELRVHLEGLRVERRAFDGVELKTEFPSIGIRVLLLSGCWLEDLGLVLLTVVDATQQRHTELALQRAEEQRRQSETMEMVGRLAGGIAHDFNNLLTVVIGDVELLRDTPEPDDALELVNEIDLAARKAAALTDQLLSFGRRKVLRLEVFDLNVLISEFERMLRRLFAEPINIVVRVSREPCLVKADSGEMGRVLMNLCLNARDAMPTGGVLTIETGHVELDPARAEKDGIPAGRYVQIVVADTGIGMDAATCRHAFEPFFTTKHASEGAGLGLATVFGILSQTGGTVSCDSEVGHGTRFRVLLPVPDAAAIDRSIQHAQPRLALAPRGVSEVVLLVEDQDDVRRLTRKVLERSGYVVLEANDGRAGLSIILSHPDKIDVLVSDVVMPELSGGALAKQALVLRPNLKVLFVSGHTEDTIVKGGVTQGAAFLQKPYTPADLARKVREVLDVGRGQPA